VVAGGYSFGSPVDTVMILNVVTLQWSAGPSTPISWYDMKSTVIEGTWYLMGGSPKDIYDVYSASLEAIVTQPPTETSNTWRKLTPLDSKRSCPLNVRGSLLAVGGRNKGNEQVSAITCYVPEIDAWVTVGDLPQTLYLYTCITVTDKLYVVGGDKGFKRIKIMHYSII